MSRITVRQSLGNLERDGLIVRRRAKGTRVAEPRIEADLEQIRSFDSDMRAQGHEPVTLAYEIGVVPSEEAVARALGCGVGDSVYRLLRLRGTADRPIGWFETHLPARLRLDLAGDYSGSLYALLENRYGAPVVLVDESLEATGAPPELAHKLGLSAGDPVLKQVRTGYDHNRQPIEYTVVHFRGDIYRYRYRHHR
ncbi:GntR family transcriptional regulator [bacterium]|nr:GntR family transcriptional regulator [bacterium]